MHSATLAGLHEFCNPSFTFIAEQSQGVTRYHEATGDRYTIILHKLTENRAESFVDFSRLSEISVTLGSRPPDAPTWTESLTRTPQHHATPHHTTIPAPWRFAGHPMNGSGSHLPQQLSVITTRNEDTIPPSITTISRRDFTRSSTHPPSHPP